MLFKGLDRLWVLVSSNRSAVPEMQETPHYSHFTGKKKNSNVSHPSKDVSYQATVRTGTNGSRLTLLMTLPDKMPGNPGYFQKRQQILAGWKEGVYMSRIRSAIHTALRSRLQFSFASALLHSVVPCPDGSFITDPQPHLHAVNNSSHK